MNEIKRYIAVEIAKFPWSDKTEFVLLSSHEQVLAAKDAELASLSQSWRNIVAVICQDDGTYREQHGREETEAHCVQAVSELRAEIERWRSWQATTAISQERDAALDRVKQLEATLRSMDCAPGMLPDPELDGCCAYCIDQQVLIPKPEAPND